MPSVIEEPEAGSLYSIEQTDLQELYAPLCKALLGRVMNRRREFRGNVTGVDRVENLCRSAELILNGFLRVMDVDVELSEISDLEARRQGKGNTDSVERHESLPRSLDHTLISLLGSYLTEQREKTMDAAAKDTISTGEKLSDVPSSKPNPLLPLSDDT